MPIRLDSCPINSINTAKKRAGALLELQRNGGQLKPQCRRLWLGKGDWMRGVQGFHFTIFLSGLHYCKDVLWIFFKGGNRNWQNSRKQATKRAQGSKLHPKFSWQRRAHVMIKAMKPSQHHGLRKPIRAPSSSSSSAAAATNAAPGGSPSCCSRTRGATLALCSNHTVWEWFTPGVPGDCD